MTYSHSSALLVRFFTHILTRFILALTPLNGSHSLLLRVICCVRYSNSNDERGQECKWVGKQEEVISLHSISVSQHCTYPLCQCRLYSTLPSQVPCIWRYRIRFLFRQTAWFVDWLIDWLARVLRKRVLALSSTKQVVLRWNMNTNWRGNWKM